MNLLCALAELSQQSVPRLLLSVVLQMLLFSAEKGRTALFSLAASEQQMSHVLHAASPLQNFPGFCFVCFKLMVCL